MLTSTIKYYFDDICRPRTKILLDDTLDGRIHLLLLRIIQLVNNENLCRLFRVAIKSVWKKTFYGKKLTKFSFWEIDMLIMFAYEEQYTYSLGPTVAFQSLSSYQKAALLVLEMKYTLFKQSHIKSHMESRLGS